MHITRPRIEVRKDMDDEHVRVEVDSMGEVRVPANHYWGAQTARACEHFALGDHKMPKALIDPHGQRAGHRTSRRRDRLWRISRRISVECVADGLGYAHEHER